MPESVQVSTRQSIEKLAEPVSDGRGGFAEFALKIEQFINDTDGVERKIARDELRPVNREAVEETVRGLQLQKLMHENAIVAAEVEIAKVQALLDAPR